MSSVLHPIGSEPPQTYWVRRVLVIAAVVVIIVLLAVLILSRGGQQEAVPGVAGTPSGVAAPQGSTAPPASSMTPSPPTPTGSSVSPSSEASSKSSPSSTAEKGSAKPSASPTPSKTETPVCSPQQLRVTLTGKRQAKVKEELTFNLSLINGGAGACIVEVSGDNLKLKIYSGTDRIWSSADCPKQVKEISQKVGPEKAVDWQMTWDGKRSVKGCKTRSEVPRPGTYFATAQLKEGKPVQLGMTLR